MADMIELNVDIWCDFLVALDKVGQHLDLVFGICWKT